MNWIRRIFLAAAVLVLCSCHQTQKILTESQIKAIEKKVRQVHNEISNAAANADVEKMFSFVAENNNGIMVNNGTILMTRQESLDSYKERFRNIEKIQYNFDQQYVTVLSSETVLWIDQGSYKATTRSGQTFGAPFMQTTVFVLENNQWKAFHSHASGETVR